MKQVQLRFTRNIGVGQTQDNFSIWQPVVNKTIEILSIAAFADLVNTTTQARSRMFGLVQIVQDNINIEAFGGFAPLGPGITFQTDNISYAFGHGEYEFMTVPIPVVAGQQLTFNVSALAEVVPANASVMNGAVSILYREIQGAGIGAGGKSVEDFDFGSLEKVQKTFRDKPFGSLE